MEKQKVSDIRKTKSDLRNMHYLFIRVVKKTHEASNTVNLEEAVMKWYVQVHWCSMNVSSVETKSAADTRIMGRYTEFSLEQVMVEFVKFQRDMVLQIGAHSLHFTVHLPFGRWWGVEQGGKGGAEREGVGERGLLRVGSSRGPL